MATIQQPIAKQVTTTRQLQVPSPGEQENKARVCLIKKIIKISLK
jgi:hypothetical protein